MEQIEENDVLDDKGFILLYHGVKPDTIMDTQWGYLSGTSWLQKEKERIKAKGGICRIKYHSIKPTLKNPKPLFNLELWVIPSTPPLHSKKAPSAFRLFSS